MAQGGGSAFTRLQKPDDNIGQSLQYWGGLKAQEIEADKGRAERKGIREDKERAEWETKFGLAEDDFVNKITGFTNYDQIKTDFAQQVSDRYVDLYRKANEAMMSGNTKDRRNYETQMMRLKGVFKQVQSGDEVMGKRFQDYVKMAQEGKVSTVEGNNWEASSQAMLKDFNYRLTLDDNLNVRAVGMKQNTDGGTEPFEMNFLDLMNGDVRPYERQEIRGKGGLVDNILMNLGKKKVDSRSGVLITTSQNWDDIREKATNGQIKSLLTSDEVMADLYSQMVDNNSRKKKGFTDEEREQVSKELFDLVRGGYSEEEKVTVDTREQALAETIRDNRERRAIAREGLKAKLQGGKKKMSKVEEVDLANRSKSVIAYAFAKRLGEIQKANPNISDRQILKDPEILKMRNTLGISADEIGLTFGRHTLGRAQGKIKIGSKIYDIENKGKIAQAIADDIGFAYDGRVVEDDFEEIGGYKGLYDKDMLQVIKRSDKRYSDDDSEDSFDVDDFLKEQGITD